jgi:hypothetical protein
MLSHLKETVTGLRVIASYYTDTERYAVLDAATIADLPCVLR